MENMETCLTIYVTFEGMGLCCFNPVEKRAEIAFLRLDDHFFNIKILGTDGRYKTLAGIANDAKIELISEKTTVNGFALNNDGKFNRLAGLDSQNDPLDLRWLIDFENGELHASRARPRENNDARQTRKGNGVKGLTEMRLPNAYFFTEQILSDKYRLLQIESGEESRSDEFGLIGDTLGARVDAVKASLVINGEDVFRFDENADPKKVTRFFVNISNVCEAPENVPPASDFQKYYEVLDFGDGKIFDFNIPYRGRRPAICELALLSRTETLVPFIEKWNSEHAETE